MQQSVFKFKEFELLHGHGSMKAGVDAVLLGAWAAFNESSETPGEILDIGTGCGIIALILAQRFKKANIEGIDCDRNSIEESRINFKNSPWSNRMTAKELIFPAEILKIGKKYDLIVCNPPYFLSGINNPVTAREKARHQDSLSIFSLIKNSPYLLCEKGILSVIFPKEFLEETLNFGTMMDLKPSKICMVRDNPIRPEKRVMVEFKVIDPGVETIIENLTLFNLKDGQREPTDEYKRLCKDFYLKF